MADKKKVKVIEAPAIDRFLRPVNNFLHTETSGGILLLIMTITAMIWANSPFSDSYFSIFSKKIMVSYQSLKIDMTVLLWINDLLMAIFFFVVGLEIKREIIVGELSSVKKASLPIIGAIGGMIIPALIYILFNGGTDADRGWGIPVATDIAFSIGILSLLGKRVPVSLKVFLTAFAIADDIGAVLVIAIFYTAKLSITGLIVASGILIILVVLNMLKIMRPVVYVFFGIFLWFAVYASGVHATVAGVLLAFTIPARARINAKQLMEKSKHAIKTIDKGEYDEKTVPVTPEFLDSIHKMETACEHVTPPLHRLEYKLHPYVAYLIMPLFALANAGVKLDGNILASLMHPITLGVTFGLFFGKQFGIYLFSWLAYKFKFAMLPGNSSLRQLYGVACIGGIGFTMSLFVASLAFDNPVYLDFAKVGILAGSLLSGITGYLILRTPVKDNAKK